MMTTRSPDAPLLLEVRDLVTSYGKGDRRRAAVDGVSLEIAPGERVGLVGESGSGKTTLASSILRILPSSSSIDGGRISLAGTDLLTVAPAALRELRSTTMARIPQDPLSSLNPVFTIGVQLRDVLTAHGRYSRAEIRERSVAALRDVGIGDPATKLRSYPHELSGGMRQRVLIAMALLNDPQLLIADEPTTALDVTVQAQVIELIKRSVASRGMALLVISHDIGVVSELCDRVLVMLDGRIVEEGPVDRVFSAPEHAYTKALLRAVTGSAA